MYICCLKWRRTKIKPTKKVAGRLFKRCKSLYPPSYQKAGELDTRLLTLKLPIKGSNQSMYPFPQQRRNLYNEKKEVAEEMHSKMTQFLDHLEAGEKSLHYRRDSFSKSFFWKYTGYDE